MTAFFDRNLEASNAEALRRHQWDKLTRLARTLVPANPFVTQKWKAAGLTGAEDLRSWDDFSRLPFTRKAEFVADQAEHPPFGSICADCSYSIALIEIDRLSSAISDRLV